MKPYKLISKKNDVMGLPTLTLKKRVFFFFWQILAIEVFSYTEWNEFQSIHSNKAFEYLLDEFHIDPKDIIIEDFI